MHNIYTWDLPESHVIDWSGNTDTRVRSLSLALAFTLPPVWLPDFSTDTSDTVDNSDLTAPTAATTEKRTYQTLLANQQMPQCILLRSARYAKWLYWYLKHSAETDARADKQLTNYAAGWPPTCQQKTNSNICNDRSVYTTSVYILIYIKFTQRC